MKILNNWLRDYLGDNTPTPEKIEELLTFHTFEIEGVEGEVIDVDVLPNRSADCLCHRGIAREIATLLDVELVNDPLRENVALPETDRLKINLLDIDSTRRFSLALMEGVKVGPSPEWLRLRLEALGQRSISNVVDATNYVMLSLGQPLHAYDADKFKNKDGQWHFGVRFAEEGEKITTLTGEEYELSSKVQLIVNEVDGALAGVAGIKGGKYAEVDENTTNIILEAGTFDGTVTRLASQFLKLQTDASKRYENGVPAEVAPYALKAVATLIKEIAGGEIIGASDVYPEARLIPTVEVKLENINRLLGLSLDADTVEKIILRTGSKVKRNEDTFLATGPFERIDLNIEADYIEEVGRIYGYSNVESVTPETISLTEVNARHFYSDQIREVLVEAGFSEVITSSFRKKDEVKLFNALASDKGCLRSSLAKNINEALDKNAPFIDLLGTKDTRIFEIGTVFEKGEGEVKEHTALAFGVRFKTTGYSGKEDAIVKEVVAKVEEALGASAKWNIEKGIAEMNLTALLPELPAPSAYVPFVKQDDIVYKPFSLYPSTSRDIALWVPNETKSEEIESLLRENAGELCVRLSLFDEFQKDGRTSYAFRLVFQSMDKTLSDEDVSPTMEKIYEVMKGRGFEVR